MSYTLVKKLLNLCSRMIILPCPKRKAKALRVKHFFIRNIQNRFTHEEQDYSELAGMSVGFSELWKLLARCPAVSWFPVSLNLQFCCWCFKAPLNSEECLSQHLWGSAQWGFLSRVRPTEVTESQWETQSWKTTQQKTSPRTSLSVYATLHFISLSEDAASSL